MTYYFFVERLISKKLGYLTAEKYKVVDNSYWINLPSLIKVYLVFAPDRLRKVTTDPLPGQEPDPGPMVKTNSEQEWEVERYWLSVCTTGSYSIRPNGCRRSAGQ